MQNPLVSILIPIYNVEQYIERCCRSLFEQTYEEIEYIFVDDQSLDKSVLVLKQTLYEYPNKKDSVRLITHERNKGLAGSRNTGLSAASGKYIMFVDSDDYIEVDTIRQTMEAVFEKDADVVVFDMNHVYKNNVVTQYQNISPDHDEYICSLLMRKTSVCVCGKLFKRSLFVDNQITFVEGLNFGEDYVVSPRVIYYSKNIVYLAKCLYNYVHLNTSSYTNRYTPSNITQQLQAESILTSFFEQEANYSKYKEALSFGRLSIKREMLVACFLNYSTMKSYIEQVRNLFPNERTSSIPLKDRIIIKLAQKGFRSLLYAYIHVGFKLKQLLK